MASNEAVHSAGSLARAFGALLNPRIGWVVLVSILLTVAALAVLWAVMAWLLTGFEIFRWGWANWIVDTFTGLAIFFAVLLVAPAVVLMITGLFLSWVVAAVERRHYPDLPAARDIPLREDIAGVLRFTGLLLLLNLLVLPLYLLSARRQFSDFLDAERLPGRPGILRPGRHAPAGEGRAHRAAPRQRRARLPRRFRHRHADDGAGAQPRHAGRRRRLHDPHIPRHRRTDAIGRIRNASGRPYPRASSCSTSAAQ